MSPTTIPLSDLVGRSQLFGPLSEASQLFVQNRARSLQLGEGETLYHRADPADRYFGLQSGQVRFCVQSAEGKTITTNFAKPGDWFGELGLFEGGTRLVDAVASAPCEIIAIPRADLLDLAAREPALFLPVVQLLGQRIRLAGELLEDAIFHDVTYRLARRLLDLLDLAGEGTPEGTKMTLHLSQEELGHMVGATREAVGRQLAVWKKKHWISLEYGKISILNRDALAEIVLTTPNT